MKEKNQAPQSARPRVMLAIIVIPLIVIGLLISFGHKRPAKSVEPKQTQIFVQKLAGTPVRHLQEIAYAPPTKPKDDVAPETEAALAQFGLSAKNGIKLSVVTHSLPPMILPKTQ